MPAALEFFKPTFIKTLFLMEWVLFILICFTSGTLEGYQQLLVAVYPLLFFYLIACILASISQRRQWLAGKWAMAIFASGLFLLDQAMKQIVAVTIKEDAFIPVLDDWLQLANLHNDRGSWIQSFFDVQWEIARPFANIAVGIVLFLGLILFHRFYVATRRKSLWADVAFLGFFSGYAGFLYDINVRGYVLDYIRLPHIVAADLKDITLAIGLAAFFAEILDNPAISLREAFRWQGWRKEWDSLTGFIREIGAFTIGELRNFPRSVRWKKSNSVERDET